jgi:ferredoxin
MKVSADRNICIGAGMCVLTAPAVFDQDDDGAVALLAEDVRPASPTASDKQQRCARRAHCVSGKADDKNQIHTCPTVADRDPSLAVTKPVERLLACAHVGTSGKRPPGRCGAQL